VPAVEVIFTGLIRAVIPASSESYDVPADSTLGELLARVVRRHGPRVAGYLLDDSGRLAASAAVLVGGWRVRELDAPIGREDSVQVVVMSPMMIGG
jgi:hypothetical protein